MTRFLPILFLLLCQTAEAQNFTGPPEYVQRAERAREQLAKFWIGKELPIWDKPCPIRVEIKPDTRLVQSSGGGATTMSFAAGEVFGWRMRVEGPKDKVLNDVIPHEVDHAVRASIVRRPMVRWLDEGLATLFEGPESHKRYREIARRNTRSSFSAFGRFDSGDYCRNPNDCQVNYATGFSVVEWLLTTQGKDRLWQFVVDRRKPSQKFRAHFGMSVAEGEARWVTWCMARQTDCKQCGCYINGNKTLLSEANYAEKPTLFVVTASWCTSCIPFNNDFNNDPIFRKQITDNFNVKPVDFDKYAAWARSKGVTGIPAFVVGDGALVGYNVAGSDPKVRLLNWLNTPDDPRVRPAPVAGIGVNIAGVQAGVGVGVTRRNACNCRECFIKLNARIEQLEVQIEHLSQLDGPTGPPGKPGVKGDDGRSIKSASVQNGDLILVYDDGTSQNVGSVRGPPGEPGKRGDSADQQELNELKIEVNNLKAGFTFKVIGVDGSESQRKVKPGDTLTIRQTPIKVKGVE